MEKKDVRNKNYLKNIKTAQYAQNNLKMIKT